MRGEIWIGTEWSEFRDEFEVWILIVDLEYWALDRKSNGRMIRCNCENFENF